MIAQTLIGWPLLRQWFSPRQAKVDRFAAERRVVLAAYDAASKRRDTRGMNAASAEMQRLTHAQLRAELGR